MAKITYNESIFTTVHKVDAEGNPIGVVLASKINQKNNQGFKLFDMIDADWDGAWIESMHTYLNTTEDLISVINILNTTNTVSYMNEALIWLTKQMNEVTASYVTKSYLGDVLSSYQNTLIPGRAIQIDPETNIISAYNTVTEELLAEILPAYLTREDATVIYYRKDETDERIARYGQYIKDLIVDDAPEEFDTLHKISNWISKQMLYTPVNYEDLILDGHHEYYIKNNDGTFTLVDEEYINEHPEDQYYERLNISDIYDEIHRVEDRIGYKTYNEETDTYTYSGILYDIYQLYDVTNIHSDNINTIFHNIFDINSRIDLIAQMSNMAYDMGYEAYVTSAYTLQMALESSDMAYTAYQVAVKAQEDVGIPAYEGIGFYPLDEEGISYSLSHFIDLYVYNEEDNTYYKTTYHDNWDVVWYAYDGIHHGTGLTGRVETCEENIANLTDKINTNDEQVLRSLYNLHTDNENAQYVSVDLLPAYFDPIQRDPNRTLILTTYTAYINSQTGEVVEEGLINSYVMRDIYSYLSSWIILGSDEDI